MDEKDMKIVEMLMKNARIPKTKIAKELKVTETAVRKRISKLECKGVIVGYKAVVNCKVANLACSLTGLDVKPERIWNVIEELKNIDEIVSMWMTSGDHSLMLEIIAENIDELSKVHKKIEEIEGVVRVCPSIILDVLK